MKEKYTDLTLTRLTEEDKKHCDTPYSILVRQKTGTAHTAFYTEEGLNIWLEKTGLKVGEKCYSDKTYKLIGEYEEICLFAIEPHLPDSSNIYNIRTWTNEDLDQFGEKNNLVKSVWLDNGDYTTCYIFKQDNGNTIYYLNPNCRTRDVHDYKLYGWK